jgi:anti-sigma factor RsiW
LSEGAAPEVLSSDRHTVKPWFAGRLPFSFNLPETLPVGAALVGADLAYVEGRPAALLMFTVGKHKATVLVMQRDGLVQLPRMRAGFSMRSAAAGELEMLAVSDVNAAELEGVLEAVVRAQE